MPPHEVIRFTKITAAIALPIIMLFVIMGAAGQVPIFLIIALIVLLPYAISNAIVISLYWRCYNCDTRLPPFNFRTEMLYCPHCAADVEKSYRKYNKK